MKMLVLVMDRLRENVIQKNGVVRNVWIFTNIQLEVSPMVPSVTDHAK